MPRYDTPDHILDQTAIFVHSKDEVQFIRSGMAQIRINDAGQRETWLPENSPFFAGKRVGVDDALSPGAFYRRATAPYAADDELEITRGEFGPGIVTVRFPKMMIGKAWDRDLSDDEARSLFREFFARSEVHYKKMGAIPGDGT